MVHSTMPTMKFLRREQCFTCQMRKNMKFTRIALCYVLTPRFPLNLYDCKITNWIINLIQNSILSRTSSASTSWESRNWKAPRPSLRQSIIPEVLLAVHQAAQQVILLKNLHQFLLHLIREILCRWIAQYRFVCRRIKGHANLQPVERSWSSEWCSREDS